MLLVKKTDGVSLFSLKMNKNSGNVQANYGVILYPLLIFSHEATLGLALSPPLKHHQLTPKYCYAAILNKAFRKDYHHTVLVLGQYYWQIQGEPRLGL